jgi:hypothetical protein
MAKAKQALMNNERREIQIQDQINAYGMEESGL